MQCSHVPKLLTLARLYRLQSSWQGSEQLQQADRRSVQAAHELWIQSEQSVTIKNKLDNRTSIVLSSA